MSEYEKLEKRNGSKRSAGKKSHNRPLGQEEQNQPAPSAGEQSYKVHAREIEVLEAAALKPIPTNPRRHSRENVAKIARSIQTYGWTTPVLISEGLEVIAGHGRLLAAKLLGQDQIPCIRLSHLTPELVEAYRIADNRLALDSEWDDQLLTEAIRRLGADTGFDLTLTGFGQDEIDDFLFIAGDGLTGDDDVPAPEAEVVSAAGDIWQLGNHRLMCDDCTNPKNVSRLIAGASVRLVVTDPPYGVGYDPKWRENNPRLCFDSTKRVDYMERRGDPIQGDQKSDWTAAISLADPQVVYCWHAAGRNSTKEVLDGLIANGFEIRGEIVWVKDQAPIAQGGYSYQHESCAYAARKGGTVNWRGPMLESTVINASSVNATSGEDFQSDHACQKPAVCMRKPILNHTDKGDVVYDPFMGSGTTIIAAQSIDRIALGMEIEPAFVDVAIRRWQAYTGQVARLVAADSPFHPLGESPTFEEVAQWRKTK